MRFTKTNTRFNSQRPSQRSNGNHISQNSSMVRQYPCTSLHPENEAQSSSSTPPVDSTMVTGIPDFQPVRALTAPPQIFQTSRMKSSRSADVMQPTPALMQSLQAIMQPLPPIMQPSSAVMQLPSVVIHSPLQLFSHPDCHSVCYQLYLPSE